MSTSNRLLVGLNWLMPEIEPFDTIAAFKSTRSIMRSSFGFSIT